MAPGAAFGVVLRWESATSRCSSAITLRNFGASILHDGFRSFAEGRKHARRDWMAIGAVCAKPLRAGHWSILRVVAVEFGANAVWPLVHDALRLKVPRGFGRVEAFVRGFVGGLLTPVDRKKLLFVSKAR